MKTIYNKLQVIKATIGPISKQQDNPFYKSKYFDINQLLEQLEPLFQEQGLICLQPIIGRYVITEIIDLETEKKVTSALELPEIADPQKLGSAITYYRRYTLQSLLGLQAEDDDGNHASNKTVKPETVKKAIPKLTEKQFLATSKATPKQIQTVLSKYAMSKEWRTKLTELLNAE